MYIDAHFHLIQTLEKESLDLCSCFTSVTCCHSKDEFIVSECVINQNNLPVKSCFGLHPQNPFYNENEGPEFLEKLLKEKRIDGIGECGFDYYNQEFKSNCRAQEDAFVICLEFAEKYNKPLIIHNRKALEKIYQYSMKLKKIKAVVFHGFGFGEYEAESILEKGINAYFSFGKALLRGNKKSIECVKKIPLEKILLETDAPYMTIKNEDHSSRQDIIKVYDMFFNLNNIHEEDSRIKTEITIEENFKNIFD